MSRLVDHPYNFTPIAAMALFAGCYLRTKWGILLPLAAMLASDYFIGFYDWQVMAAVYASFALVFTLGWLLRKYKNWHNIILASLVSSVMFFVVTNLAVWAFFNWYAHTREGLIYCFTLALPFFRNTLAGDLSYTVLFFGAYESILLFADKKVIKNKIAHDQRNL
ncbi:hypothetical protein COT99_00135 [Candidatus Falkowbacteria bacterium CG10_big_fil_rev_8_21_14_0_10_43_10]|uniref:Uncharacterized protein n=1 Tax=Candidatus Falkowbacteria bacterium CG10_big_fil_rev_8_21_14_0_10_43_10 TaxID=1974567 RepID=A0A2H0V379_9BACT|nr:MAG: hypothetical protein COT99_00135 [Candidatus Falkowbacteria bacterium CG10_big_fil_rev_8_21_14_0_10_43_10]